MRSCNGLEQRRDAGNAGKETVAADPSSPRTVFKDKYTVAACAIKWMLKTPSVSHSVYGRKILEETALGGEKNVQTTPGGLNGVERSQSHERMLVAGAVRNRFGCFTERQWGQISVIEASCPGLIQG